MLLPNTLGLPGPSLWDMARGFRAIRADPLTFLEQTQTRYGDLVALPVPGAPTLLLSDPEAVRYVLAGNARNWTKATVQYSSLATVTGPGLLAVSDDRWLGRRRTAAPAFHQSRVDAIGASVAEVARKVVDSWARTAGVQIVDVDSLSMQITLEVIGRNLFDCDIAALADIAELVRATDEAAELVVAQGRSLPWPSWMPSSVNRRLRESVAVLDDICRQLITDRRRRGVGERDSGPDSDRDSDRDSDLNSDLDSDLLGLLIAAGLPDDAIRDELVTMVVAGHETVASALTWTLMLLAEHPQAQQRLRDEARKAAGKVAGTEVREVDSYTPMRLREQLPWTRAVVDESLRLFPPGWVLSRRAERADSVGGQAVPAGTRVIISPWLLHRNASSWPDPEEFRPERFLGETGEVTPAARLGYVPFGLGPRLCIGRDFALVELTILLVELLADHVVELPRGWRRPEVDAFVTLRPRGGLRLVIRPWIEP